MCAIAGFSSNKLVAGQQVAATAAALGVMRHRGPDDTGIWKSDAENLVLGHNRLSVLDLSSAGHQPMVSQDSRYVITFNGEIYNFRDLRKQLEGKGAHFLGHSDTEILLAAIFTWGVVGALQSLTGMFAIGIWDQQDRQLWLARDRAGEKPIYYGNLNGDFAFASELKGLRALPNWSPQLDNDAIALQMRFGYVPAPHCIYMGINKLLPGHYVTIKFGDQRVVSDQIPYWDPGAVAQQQLLARNSFVSREDSGFELESLLTDVVGRQMVSDVPVGVFLSGGLDSTVVAAMAQSVSTNPIKSFSIGFDQAEFNEAPFAKSVADHLGTSHTELYVTAEDAQQVIPLLPDIYDEPFSDSSQIPTYLVSKLARGDVTVALSGDGGDEIFGGYNRYLLGHRLFSYLDKVPRGMKSPLGSAISAVHPHLIDGLTALLRPVLPEKYRFSQVSEKLCKLASALQSRSEMDAYLPLVELWSDSKNLVVGSSDTPFLESHRRTLDVIEDFSERMMFADTVTYLPNDILTKVDRASMAVSLEARAPFLDHAVIEFMWRQPPSMKICGRETKCLLRDIAYRHAPRELLERPKMGFGVPIGDWLRGPLQGWAGDLLAEDRLRDQGIFDVALVQRKWREHISGEKSWQHLLWAVLMFQAWHDRWVG